MIAELALLRELTLSRAPQAGRALHLSAASGLVCCGEWLYVIADDENHLGVFPLADHAAPGDQKWPHKFRQRVKEETLS